ncbi:hypothetical protein [Marinimicrobium agarilyticum]|uniref:hypothetical protein n=1 Tax=Marinimicrobium agarilyticum TaxID=306546 RepID=UPI00041BD49C|nr:hypothetical protein [Marinimicrobium agarilyticum]
MNPSRMLIAALLIITLASCGGGSESRKEKATQLPEKEPVPANLFELASISNFQPSVQKPQYTGSFNRATITQENGPHFAWALFEMLAAAYSVGNDMDLQKPFPFHRDYKPVNMRNMSCQTGSRDREALEFSDHLVEIITYNNCVTAKGTVTGQIVLKSRLNLLRKPDKREALFRQLTFHRDDEYTMVDGLVELNDHRQYTIMLTLVNSVLGELYYTEDLFVNGVSPQGKIYHNRWGYVDVESGLVGNSWVRQKGENYTLQEFDFHLDEEWKLGLKLTSDRKNARYSSFPQSKFPDFPHTNRPPVLQWTVIKAQDSIYSTTLDFSLSNDPDQDYLSFEWDYVQAPPGCDSYSLQGFNEPPDFGTLWVYSSCPGRHLIRASLFDGTTTVSEIITIKK